MTDTQLIPFDYHGHDVRVIEKNGDPWWVAKDVAQVLEYKNPRDAIAKHCKMSEILTSRNATFEIPNRGMTIIPETVSWILISYPFRDDA